MTALASAEGAELVESPTLRSRHLTKTDVLDRVGELAMLPRQALSTVKQVAEFYGVSIKTVESVVEDNRSELESNGYEVLRGSAVAPFRGAANLSPKARSLALFSRTAALNVGMLLTESEPARLVRRYLLAVEATATDEHKTDALKVVRLQERMDYRNVLTALMKGGADSEDYALVQNLFYLGLFGKTASQIKRTQPQASGVPLKRGTGFRKSSTAKDYLTKEQLALLNNAVLATTAQIGAHYPGGRTTVAEMQDLANAAIRLVMPRVLVSSGAA